MIKLGETSILSFPIIFLKWLFPSVRAYYSDTDRPTDGFEHHWTGAIADLVVAVLMVVSRWAWVALPVAFFFHVIWKQVIHDHAKNLLDPETMWVDILVSSSGFVMWSWAPILILLSTMHR